MHVVKLPFNILKGKDDPSPMLKVKSTGKTVFRVLASIFVAVSLARSASAQGTSFDRLTPAFPTAGERTAADVASWVTVGTAVALDLRAAWRSGDRKHQLHLAGARIFATWTLASLAKGLAHRERPDGSNNLSFYSMHTAMAFQTLGGPRVSVALPLSVGTGGLRVAAGKHWLTDVLVGAGVGALTSRIR